MNDEGVTVETMPEQDLEPPTSVDPVPGSGANGSLDQSDIEYADFHAFYHSTMNFLADRVFTDGDHIDYPTLLQVFVAMHRSAPRGSTAFEVLDDHLDDLVTPLLSVLFGH